MSPRRFFTSILPLAVVAAIVGLVGWAARSPLPIAASVSKVSAGDSLAHEDSLAGTVERINAHFHERWREEGLADGQMPTENAAPDLTILRRLALGLHGTIPSLEEIRQFEADDRPDRLDRWTTRMLADDRFADYFAERLARSFVGREQGQFVVFRRDRFVHWLAEQLRARTPYDQIVRAMISATGLWTGRPATNFVTAAVNDGDIDENKLAGKSVRAFLGQRIDCAQCHDHPFASWKQPQFEGLAAFFGQVQTSLVGIEDKSVRDGQAVDYKIEDRMTLAERIVPEGVPFHPEWLPETGTRRERLAAWIIHPENKRFERAIANRVWALLFGRAYHEPVDDLPDPPESSTDLLDLLGTDFRAHSCDLRRLIRVIAACEPFRRSSEWPATQGAADAMIADLPEIDSRRSEADRLTRSERAWVLFPLIRLRPEQVIGSIRQSSSIQTCDRDSHWIFRTLRLLQEAEFVREYGDLGEDELADRGGTIPQRLLLLNGKRAGEAAAAGPINAAGRIAAMASTDEKCIETAYLVTLTRRPTLAEIEHFAGQLAGRRGPARQEAIEDMIWALYNSTEFSWNH